MARLKKATLNEITRIVLANAPEGRTVPVDVALAGANCGPAAVAAYTGRTCTEIIEAYPEYVDKEYISQTPMLALLKRFGRPHKRVTPVTTNLPSEAFMDFGAGLGLIQWNGPGNAKYSGWGAFSIEYAQTHWIAWASGKIYDRNNEATHVDQFGCVPLWIDEDEWFHSTVPIVKPKESPSFRFRALLVPD